MKIVTIISAVISALIYLEYGWLLFGAFGFIFLLQLYFLYQALKVADAVNSALSAVRDSQIQIVRTLKIQESYYQQQIDKIVKLLSKFYV